MKRRLPNVLVTGTPGTGKTTLSSRLALAHGLRHLDISKIVKEEHLYESYNEEWDSYDIEDDKVLDALEERMKEAGNIFDFHTADLIPDRWVDLVVVLTTDHTILWKRLEQRNYSLRKIQENNEAEIMMVVYQDVMDTFDTDKIIHGVSDTMEDLEQVQQRIASWLKKWKS